MRLRRGMKHTGSMARLVLVIPYANTLDSIQKKLEAGGTPGRADPNMPLDINVALAHRGTDEMGDAQRALTLTTTVNSFLDGIRKLDEAFAHLGDRVNRVNPSGAPQ